MKPRRPYRRIVTGRDADGEPYADILHIRPAEWVDGRHFTSYVPEVEAARKRGDHAEATRLLERLVGHLWAVTPVPPWYVEQLAIEYRRAGRGEDERALLERYITATEGTRRDARGVKLVARLAKMK